MVCGARVAGHCPPLPRRRSDAIDALLEMPEAGPPKDAGNPQLSGLRSWHVKGFDEFRVYYLANPALLIIVRILHSKRDTGAILTRQELEEP